MSDVATETNTTATTGTVAATTTTYQAAADALAAQAAKTAGEGAVKTAEQIVTEAATKEVVYALTMPKDSVLEADALEQMTAFAKDHKLSPEAAQKALEHTNAALVADRAKQMDATVQTFQTLARETWPNEIKADKEFGGDKFDATTLECERAAAKAWTPEERKILNETGWGNHPMLVRGMARLGRMMANDSIVTGNAGGAGKGKSDGQVIYPNMNP